MLSMKRAVELLIGQGADPIHLMDCVKALRSEAFISDTLDGPGVAALILGAACPDGADVLDFVERRLRCRNQYGRTFLEVMMERFTHVADMRVISLRIVQDLPVMWLEYSNGDADEFLIQEFVNKGFRREVQIFGGTISALAVHLGA